MTVEGELTVRLDWDGRRVQGVTIRSSRPFAVAQALAGRAPEEAAAMVPRLYSLCAEAQGAAAASAAAAATGVDPGSRPPAARESAVVHETVQEHLWRLLVDWPQIAGREPHYAPVALARKAVAAARAGTGAATAEAAATLAAVAQEAVYGESAAGWLATGDAAALEAWLARAGTVPAALLAELLQTYPHLGRSTVALMPAATESALRRSILPALEHEAGFQQTPLWDGTPAETGALARTRDHPLVAALRARDGNTAATRMVARLVELAQLVAGLPRSTPWVQGFAPVPGDGVGAVQTARGLLVHRVRVAAGRVHDYRIVAPTEWNFGPAGPLAAGLADAEAGTAAELERQARLAVQALDPCVACRVEIGHA